MSDTTYCYPPDYRVLKNKLNLRDADLLERVERRFVLLRSTSGVPTGDFDLAHLKAIHRHLFQDIFDWAGELRTLEISKSGTQFQPMRFIATGIADVHSRIVTQNYLKGLSPSEFANLAGEIIGDINHGHPFREGNGRTQIIYLKQLAGQAGHLFDPLKIDRDEWMAASRESHHGNYGLIATCIEGALVS